MKKGIEIRSAKIAASFAISALLLPFSLPAWSQAVENSALSSNLSDRFENGEFGEPLGEARPRSAVQAAMVSQPQPQYVYYVVPCGTPGAIRAGSPSSLDQGALDPSSLDSESNSPGAEAAPAEDVCVVLVDENRSESAPLLYSYDSSYRYPSGYPNHHRSAYASGNYASSINVGYYSSRRYGAFGHHGRYPYGGRYGGFPYGGHYAGFPYGGHSYYGGYPYGRHYRSTPYVSQHYSVGFDLGYSSRRHYRSGRPAFGRFGSPYSHMHRRPRR